MSPSFRGFGPEVVTMLIRHRRPFLMVDRVDRYVLDDPASLAGHRSITANEPVFDGHFPGWAVWPGVYTIEGLGQCTQLLASLRFLARLAAKSGIDAATLAGGLAALDARRSLRPAHLEPEVREFFDAMKERRTPVGMASRVDVRLLHPVFAGQRLDYEVVLEKETEGVLAFRAKASVDGVVVADGRLVGSNNVPDPFA